MAFESLVRLQDFGVRSLVTHAIMATTFVAAILSGFLVEGDLGILSFIAFLNFTAGMWVCQSIHSLGHATTDSEYEGILSTLTRYVG